MVILEKKGIHYFNMVKIAYTRASWVLSIPNTLSILFLVWTNNIFQQNYARYFFNNFWFFMIFFAAPFLAYMYFEYRRVWMAEIDLSNQKSWDCGYNPFRDVILDTQKDVKELRKMVAQLQAARTEGAQAPK